MDREAKRLRALHEACVDALEALGDAEHPSEVADLRSDIEDFRDEVNERIETRKRFVSRVAKPS